MSAVNRVEGIDVNKKGAGLHHIPLASWAENAIISNKREKMAIASLHLQYSFVSIRIHNAEQKVPTKGNIWENFRLYKRNIVPARKSLVSDIPAGEGKTAKPFFTVYISSGIKDFDSAIVFILHQKSNP